MIVRYTNCPDCGAEALWVQREPHREAVRDAAGVLRGWRTVTPHGGYCDLDIRVAGERFVYRRHNCVKLADRRWRPGASDYIPPLELTAQQATQHVAQHESELTQAQRAALAEAERRRRAERKRPQAARGVSLDVQP